MDSPSHPQDNTCRAQCTPHPICQHPGAESGFFWLSQNFLSHRGVQLSNPFFSIWNTETGKKLAVSFILSIPVYQIYICTKDKLCFSTFKVLCWFSYKMLNCLLLLINIYPEAKRVIFNRFVCNNRESLHHVAYKPRILCYESIVWIL